MMNNKYNVICFFFNRLSCRHHTTDLNTIELFNSLRLNLRDDRRSVLIYIYTALLYIETCNLLHFLFVLESDENKM